MVSCGASVYYKLPREQAFSLDHSASDTVQVYFKLPSGKAFSLDHSPSDTVQTVIENVARSERFPSGRVRLKYQGKTLDVKKTIGYLGVCEETILKVELVPVQEWTVQIRLQGDRHHDLMIQNVDPAHRLFNMIADLPGAPTTPLQHIKVRGVGTISATDNNTSLLALGVTNGAVLDPVWSGSTTAPERDVDDELEENKKMELLGSFDTQGKRVDVVFCFDTTGSMYSCLQTVRHNIRDTVSRLLRDIPRMRIGLMANGDYCDDDLEYAVKWVDLTSDPDNLVTFASNVSSTWGGGNRGECYEWALRKAQQLDWSEESAKALVMIGDELPHVPSYTTENVFWKEEVDVLKGMGVKVYGVQALNSMASTPFYQEISERTGGYYLKLKNFSLITDMFLAVCYRESNQQQLDAFVEEVENEGRMTEDTKFFLQTLEVEKPSPGVAETAPQAEQRMIQEGWWDRAFDTNGTQEYEYHAAEDRWTKLGHKPSERSVASSVTPGYTSFGDCKDAPIHRPIELGLSDRRKRSFIQRIVRRIFRRRNSR